MEKRLIFRANVLINKYRNFPLNTLDYAVQQNV